MSAGSKYRNKTTDPTETIIQPEPFVVGELSSGARPTSTSIITIPIPEDSDVSDMSVTFRDRRSTYDDDSRTVAPIFRATKPELISSIDGWTTTDVTFAGRMWKRHLRNFNIDNTSYRYIVYVSFDTDTMYLMFQGIHAGNSNAYGGWENLTVSFSEIAQKSQLESVEVMQLVGTYYPTLAESTANLINTGIDMTHPDTYVRVRYGDSSTEYSYIANVVRRNVAFTNSDALETANTFYRNGRDVTPLLLGIINDGTIYNINGRPTSDPGQNIRIYQIEVFAPREVNVVK